MISNAKRDPVANGYKDLFLDHREDFGQEFFVIGIKSLMPIVHAAYRRYKVVKLYNGQAIK